MGNIELKVSCKYIFFKLKCNFIFIGHDLIRQYAEMNTHLKVKIGHPKADLDHEVNLPPSSRVSIPSVFLSGE